MDDFLVLIYEIMNLSMLIINYNYAILVIIVKFNKIEYLKPSFSFFLNKISKLVCACYVRVQNIQVNMVTILNLFYNSEQRSIYNGLLN